MTNINLIGKFYNPSDNSFCVNWKGKPAYLTPWHGSNKFNPTKHELNARFEIVSNPYEETIRTTFGNLMTCTFIKVKSNITGEMYRVLYKDYCVIDSFKEYIKRYNSKNPRYDESLEKTYEYYDL